MVNEDGMIRNVLALTPPGSLVDGAQRGAMWA
jgi:hypothetical protein